ncbi:hypothetical protein ABT150_34485 [Streptomyces mirabilis]|uniref:hypothetical protein n=1 Tax=Streptomyces mirabilis TaxID=68239 RepID=UPI00332F2170
MDDLRLAQERSKTAAEFLFRWPSLQHEEWSEIFSNRIYEPCWDLSPFPREVLSNRCAGNIVHLTKRDALEALSTTPPASGEDLILLLGMNAVIQETKYAIEKIDMRPLSCITETLRFFGNTCTRQVGEVVRVWKYGGEESGGVPEGARRDTSVSLPGGEILTLAVTSAGRNDGALASSECNRMLPGFSAPVSAYESTRPDYKEMPGEAFNETRSEH